MLNENNLSTETTMSSNGETTLGEVVTSTASTQETHSEAASSQSTQIVDALETNSNDIETSNSDNNINDIESSSVSNKEESGTNEGEIKQVEDIHVEKNDDDHSVPVNEGGQTARDEEKKTGDTSSNMNLPDNGDVVSTTTDKGDTMNNGVESHSNQQQQHTDGQDTADVDQNNGASNAELQESDNQNEKSTQADTTIETTVSTTVSHETDDKVTNTENQHVEHQFVDIINKEDQVIEVIDDNVASTPSTTLNSEDASDIIQTGEDQTTTESINGLMEESTVNINQDISTSGMTEHTEATTTETTTTEATTTETTTTEATTTEATTTEATTTEATTTEATTTETTTTEMSSTMSDDNSGVEVAESVNNEIAANDVEVEQEHNNNHQQTEVKIEDEVEEQQDPTGEPSSTTSSNAEIVEIETESNDEN
jgi:hypothetical protein